MDTEKKDLAMVSAADQKVTLTTDDLKTVTLDLKELPRIVSTQVNQINDLSIKVKQAMDRADKAKRSAESAKGKSTGLGHKKEAIEALQEATVDIAEAQIDAAEAQKLSFQYQQQLGKITKYLFALGVSNIAATRSVIQELQLRLHNASEEELNELAKQEVYKVIKQLEDQRDIMEKQAAQGQVLKELSTDVSAIKDKDSEQDQLLLEQAAKDEQQDQLIEEGVQKDEEQDRLIEEQAKKDEEHDRLIAEQAKKDEEHDKLLRERAEKDELHDRLFAQQAESLQRQEEKINALESEVKSLKAELSEKTGKLMGYIATGVAALAAILSIIQFIL